MKIVQYNLSSWKYKVKSQFYYYASTKKAKLTKQVSVAGHVDQLDSQTAPIAM